MPRVKVNLGVDRGSKIHAIEEHTDNFKEFMCNLRMYNSRLILSSVQSEHETNKINYGGKQNGRML